jgi:hypothetical protein
VHSPWEVKKNDVNLHSSYPRFLFGFLAQILHSLLDDWCTAASSLLISFMVHSSILKMEAVYPLWDVAIYIYICKDNHLSNCSIIFITIAQYTQMNLKNRTALAEDNSEHSNSLNVVLNGNSKTDIHNLESDRQKTCHCLHCWRVCLATAVYLAVARFFPSNCCLPGRCVAFAKPMWLVPTSS